MQKIHGQVKELGGEVVAISPQQNQFNNEIVKKHGISFPVLEDKKNQYAGKLGLNITVSEKLKKLYDTFGLDLPNFNGDDTWGLPMPARFLVDTHGAIKEAAVHPDHTTRPEPTDILEFIKNCTK